MDGAAEASTSAAAMATAPAATGSGTASGGGDEAAWPWLPTTAAAMTSVGKRADVLSLKTRLCALLPDELGAEYWAALCAFIQGRCTRAELSRVTSLALKSHEARDLHNQLVLAILFNTTRQTRPPAQFRHAGWHKRAPKQLRHAVTVGDGEGAAADDAAAQADHADDHEQHELVYDLAKRREAQIKKLVMSLSKRDRAALKMLKLLNGNGARGAPRAGAAPASATESKLGGIGKIVIPAASSAQGSTTSDAAKANSSTPVSSADAQPSHWSLLNLPAGHSSLSSSLDTHGPGTNSDNGLPSELDKLYQLRNASASAVSAAQQQQAQQQQVNGTSAPQAANQVRGARAQNGLTAPASLPNPDDLAATYTRLVSTVPLCREHRVLPDASQLADRVAQVALQHGLPQGADPRVAAMTIYALDNYLKGMLASLHELLPTSSDPKGNEDLTTTATTDGKETTAASKEDKMDVDDEDAVAEEEEEEEDDEPRKTRGSTRKRGAAPASPPKRGRGADAAATRATSRSPSTTRKGRSAAKRGTRAQAQEEDEDAKQESKPDEGSKAEEEQHATANARAAEREQQRDSKGEQTPRERLPKSVRDVETIVALAPHSVLGARAHLAAIERLAALSPLSDDESDDDESDADVARDGEDKKRKADGTAEVADADDEHSDAEGTVGAESRKKKKQRRTGSGGASPPASTSPARRAGKMPSRRPTLSSKSRQSSTGGSTTPAGGRESYVIDPTVIAGISHTPVPGMPTPSLGTPSGIARRGPPSRSSSYFPPQRYQAVQPQQHAATDPGSVSKSEGGSQLSTQLFPELALTSEPGNNPHVTRGVSGASTPVAPTPGQQQQQATAAKGKQRAQLTPGSPNFTSTDGEADGTTSADDDADMLGGAATRQVSAPGSGPPALAVSDADANKSADSHERLFEVVNSVRLFGDVLDR